MNRYRIKRMIVMTIILLFPCLGVAAKKTSELPQRLKDQSLLEQNPLGIMLYKPNYILPFYYTFSPYQQIYRGNTPDNQAIDKKEFKAQLSLELPLWRHILGKKLSLYAAYTQLFYWQFYAKSQYFRETNYEPEIFLSDHFGQNWLVNVGAVHQSNGRGGSLERSWNRAYVDVKYYYGPWLLSVKPWALIFKGQSSDLHNPNIAKFLGYERILIAYKFAHKIVLSLKIRNLEHGTERITYEGALSFPITRYINGYAQFFHGYGQSLIEYDHKTNAVGIGISLNNWL